MNVFKRLFSWTNVSMPQIGWLQIVLLCLAAATAVAAVVGLPSMFTDALALAPTGWLGIVALALGATALFGARIGILSALAAVALVAPFAQPVLAPAATALAGCLTIYGASRGGKRSLVLYLGGFTGGSALYAALYVGCALFVVPLLHTATTAVWHEMPTIFALALAAAVTSCVVRNKDRFQTTPETGFARKQLNRVGAWGNIAAMVAVPAFWIFVPYVTWTNHSQWFLSLQMRHAMEMETIEALPTTTQNSILPEPCAETFIKNLNRNYLQTTQAPHQQLRPDGKIWWQSPLHNKNRWGQILGTVTRVVAVDADRVDQHAEHIEDSGFIAGDESWLVKAAFMVRHPNSEVAATNYYLNADGSWSLLISFTSKKPTHSLPGPGTMVDYFAGVMEVSQNLVIKDHTVEQAAAQFPGVVLNPQSLLHAYSEAYAQWPGGWTGTVALQDEVFEVSEDGTPDDQLMPLPYIQEFHGLGLQEMMVFEPKGDHQYAMVEILLADAGTGKLRRLVVPDGLIGPRQARLNVRTSDTRIDWSHISRLPHKIVVTDKGVFWLVAMVSRWENEKKDQHPYVLSVLVDAKTANDCYTAITVADIEKTLKSLPVKD